MPAKPKVLLLHGVGLDHRMWAPVRILLADRFDVEAPDLLGHGAAGPAGTGITLTDLADDVAHRLVPGTHLVGFSLGALVAQHLARYRPELVATLTSVSSVCRRTAGEREAVLARLATAAEKFTDSVDASIERWFPAGEPRDEQLVAGIRCTLLANNVKSYLNCYRIFATADADLGPELGRITAPSLAITGELDPGSTPEMTRRLAEAIPDCTAVVVPGARHLLPVQKPEEFAAAFAAFVREKSYVESA